MDSGARTASSAGGPSGLRRRVADWFLLEGDRRLVEGGAILAATGAVWSLVAVGVVAVGSGSSVASAFGSGLTAGVVTLLTIALSINQLILSRVFGSPDRLMERLEGAASATGTDTPQAVTAALEDVAAYGGSIDAKVEAETPVSDILGVVIGPEYAINMTAVRHLRTAYGSELTDAARTELEAVGELPEYVAVARQFFKTLAIQQDFAVPSRLLVYSGLVALLVSVSVTLVYSTDAATLTEPTLRAAVPLALGVVLAPLALFASFILRAATVAFRTVSVSPFISPSDR